MSSGLDWERFGVIAGGDEVCVLPLPTLSEKGVGIPTFVHFPKINYRNNCRGNQQFLVFHFVFLWSRSGWPIGSTLLFRVFHVRSTHSWIYVSL